MDTLEKKIVLITGAGKGRGRQLAQAFARHGAAVAANDISPVNVEEVVDEILAGGGRAKAYIEDVAKKVGVQNIIKQTEDDFGRIDILINHAAVEPHIPLLDMDEWDWHRVLDVNLTGAFLMTQSTGRVMRAQGSGVIINLLTGSTSDGGSEAFFVRGTPAKSTRDYPGTARQGKYSAALVASMSGLEAFTHQAARELAPYGVQVHAVKSSSEKIVETVFALLDVRMEEE
jgi:NAD(P)-dependent dehydrogenase (short-subunit alcohol dehydrogenase family)